jgi:hypothetical protein
LCCSRVGIGGFGARDEGVEFHECIRSEGG